MSALKRKAAGEPASDADAKKAKQQSSLTSFFGSSTSAPKSTGSAKSARATTSAPPSAAVPESKFDKARWVAKLTPEQKDLLKLEIATLGDSWLAALKDELTTPSFLELKRFLQREHNAGKKIFPPPEDLYSW